MAALVDSNVRIDHPRMVGRIDTAIEHDDELVRAAQGGDRDAFGELYRRFGPMVHGVLLARVPYGEVDDLVQDVFLVAMQRLTTLRAPGAFGSWLGAIARHRALDYHRRLPVEPVTDGMLATVARPQADALAVLSVVQTLPAAYRETLVLRLVEGMTGQEIADRTGLTPASVRVNLHRGMKRLRRALDEKGGSR